MQHGMKLLYFFILMGKIQNVSVTLTIKKNIKTLKSLKRIVDE